MAALLSSQSSGSSAGASAAGGDCQPYSSNDFESFDSESEISSSREVGGRRRTVAVGNFRVVANADHRRPSRAHPWKHTFVCACIKHYVQPSYGCRRTPVVARMCVYTARKNVLIQKI